ncbi:MAG: LamG-like jellyroll fold domain-containing protein [bacterium]|nr:LamG-like jellyroll fold domain-containing protein [bacterium]
MPKTLKFFFVVFFWSLLLAGVVKEEAKIADIFVPDDLPFVGGLLAHYPLRSSVKDALNRLNLVYHNKQDYESFGLRLGGGPSDHLALQDLHKIFKGKQLTVALWIERPQMDQRVDQYYNVFWDGAPAAPTRPRFSLWHNPKKAIWHHSLAHGSGYDLPYQWKRHWAIVSTIDSEAQESKMFINGTLNGEFQLKTKDFSPRTNLYFGRGLAPETGLPAIYGEISLWDRVLTSDEVARLYEHQDKRLSQFIAVRWSLRALCLLGGIGLVFYILKMLPIIWPGPFYATKAFIFQHLVQQDTSSDD